jgi:hypothetical protein
MNPDSLSEQGALLQAVLGAGDAAALSAYLPKEGAVPQRLSLRGLQAYRANGHALAERALVAAYPVLAELMGQENFSALARHFWTQHPPLRGDIACWGDALAGFVDAAPQLADEPYLPDVARLEWLMHLAASAVDVETDLPSFALLASSDPAPVTLVLGAGVALLASPYPVASIVNAHLLGQPSLQQAGERLREGCAEHALVWRQGFRPCMRSSTAAEHQLLGGLIAGEPLVSVLETISLPGDSEAPAFDFNTWLAEAVQTGLVCGARLVTKTKG